MQFCNRVERVLGNKVIFSNLVIYSLCILTSCQVTNEPNREISRGVFQNRGVCGKAFPLLPTPYPFHFFFFFFFCSRSNFRAVTRLETFATQTNYFHVHDAIPVVRYDYKQSHDIPQKRRWSRFQFVITLKVTRKY